MCLYVLISSMESFLKGAVAGSRKHWGIRLCNITTSAVTWQSTYTQSHSYDYDCTHMPRIWMLIIVVGVLVLYSCRGLLCGMFVYLGGVKLRSLWAVGQHSSWRISACLVAVTEWRVRMGRLRSHLHICRIERKRGSKPDRRGFACWGLSSCDETHAHFRTKMIWGYYVLTTILWEHTNTFQYHQDGRYKSKGYNASVTMGREIKHSPKEHLHVFGFYSTS